MRPEQWTELWRIGKIGFHQTSVGSALAEHWPDRGIDPGRVFVPLCGKSLDLVWLHSQGNTVVGVEISDIALQAFCIENGVPARRRSLSSFDVYEAPGFKLYCGDFFSLTPDMVGGIDAVYDRASLIAFPPDQQRRYVDQLSNLISAGTSVLLVTLEYPQEQMPGPPFSTDARQIARLYAEEYEIQEIARRDILGSEPRLRERGLSMLSEVCYRLIHR